MPIAAAEARQALLVRAFETEAAAMSAVHASHHTAVWSTQDSDWASAEALRQVGERASPEQWLAHRSALASERLVQREPRLVLLLRPGAAGATWSIAALVVLALLAGLASDAVGTERRINILAPPLLTVMAWNLAVYLVLLVQALRRRAAAREASTVAAPPKDEAHSGSGWIRHAAQALADKLAARSAAALGLPQARRFAAEWSRASQPLQLARLATLLHLAALAVAAGALLALYARGLVFEYRAGWDSTFLGADTVHRWLSLLLAPATAISGSTLPDAAQLEAMRFSAAGEGENAARWIHWYAITTALVMAPRALLAALAMLRGRQLQRHFPLALDDRYFRRLFQWLAHSSDQSSHLAVVAPYGYRGASDRHVPLAAAIDAEFGPGLQLRMLADVPLASEDELPQDWPRPLLDADGGRVDLLLPLFALSATPERETHGRFIAEVLARQPQIDGKPRCRVMIDESGFRRRLAGADLQNRLEQRRAAWRKLLAEAGAGEALFVDLSDDGRTDE